MNQGLTPTEAAELWHYFFTLEADLEVEIDIHGEHTRMAKNLRDLIAATKKELDNQI